MRVRWNATGSLHTRRTGTAAVVVALHVAFLAAILTTSHPDAAAPRPRPPTGMAIRIIRPPRSFPLPPAVAVSFAAPPAPYIPPPVIKLQQIVVRVAATRASAAVIAAAYARDDGNGAALHAGRVPPPPSSPVFVGQGSPAYPKAYRTAGVNGFAGVVCTIETDGTADHCRLVNVEGGAAFGQAALAWLQDGQKRYRPGTRDGRPVAEPAALKFVFIPGLRGG